MSHISSYSMNMVQSTTCTSVHILLNHLVQFLETFPVYENSVGNKLSASCR